MRVKVETIRTSNNPNEVVVAVNTVAGKEFLVVHSLSLEDSSLEVGYPISSKKNSEYLVELPRETQNGSWRVWVPQLSCHEIGRGEG